MFWNRTKFELRAREDDASLFQKLIDDRPAVIGGVKHLVLKLGEFKASVFDERRFPNGVGESFPEHMNHCRNAFSSLSLETLHLDIAVTETEIEAMVSGKGKFSSLMHFREFRVSKKFTIHVIATSSNTWSTHEAQGGWYSLKCRYEAIMRDLFLPYTLRGEESEEEVYLRKRATISEV